MAGVVDCWWRLDGAPDAGDPPATILPDGHAELVFHLGDPMRRLRADGSVEWQARALAVGQMSAATRLQPSGRLSVVGVRLRPAGVRAALRVRADELTDRIEELAAVDASLARRVLDGGCLPDGPEAAAEIERRLTQALQDRVPDPLTARVAALIDHVGGRESIDRLARHVGLGSRDLERRFQRDLGLTPKRFSRLIRFQRAVAALVDGSPRLIDTALAGGYYDQAHFTREFTSFAGVSPNVWFARDCELSRYFTTAHRDRERGAHGHIARVIG